MKKRFVLLLACLLAGISLSIAQTPKEITGIVISEEDNEPVMGASVLIKGTSIGTTTNMEGKFTISNVPSSARTLKISYIGMKTEEVAIKSGVMRIILKSDSEVLEEVVVTGMTKVDKRLFTGAADQLKAANVKLDGMADISRGLEGRSAGVSVQNVSGTFGTAPKIRVRGATSIYGNSKPLWVVDGVIMDDVVEVSADQLSSGDAVTLISSAIAGLNADDIESFQILKDGSATSIYGARAMSGVIVVTTKQGKAGTNKLSYTGEFTMRMKPSYRNFNLMNSQDQMGIYKEMRDKGDLNFASVYRASNSGVYGKMYQLNNWYDKTNGMFGLPQTVEAQNAYLREAEYRNTDWFDLLFSNAVMMNHSVSYATGTDKSTSYVSVSAMVDPGWMRQNKVQRYTANLNNSYKIIKDLSLNVIANASYRQQKAPGTLGQSSDAASGTVSRGFDINPYSYALNTSRTLDPNVFYMRNYSDFNIFNELDANNISLDVLDLKFQAELKWKLFRKLELSTLGALKYSATSQEHKIREDSNQALAYRAMTDGTVINRNSWLYKNPDDPYALPVSILPKGGFYNTAQYKMLSYDFRAAASYNDVFNDTHIVNVYAGLESNAQNRTSNSFDGWGMQYDNGEIPFFDYLAFKKLREGNTDYYSLSNSKKRNVAFFGNATYSYKGRYTITGTGRYEGSNRLGKSRSARWLPTWNIAGAWNMHEEEFFKSLEPALSHFTVKASYSLTADVGPSSVSNSKIIINSYTPWRPSAGVSESGLQIVDLENSDLTYEKKHELNIGLDMGFLDNRINLEAAWYKRNNYDLIGAITTEGVGGAVERMANVASMKSHGFEFTLSTRNIEGRHFKWSTDFIFGYNKTEVTDFKSRSRVFDLISGVGFAREGYPVRGLFSIPFEGLDSDGFPIFSFNGQTVTKANYGSLNLQQSTDVDFLKYEGPTDPTITGSIGNIFTYKNFRLNIFVTYSGGNKVRLDPMFRSSYSDLDATPKDFKNRWVLPGDEKLTDIPVLASSFERNQYANLSIAYNSYNYSTARIADGAFVRLKEVSLSYDFPKEWLKSTPINSVGLKLQGTNLALLYADSKLNGQDPEFFRSGGVSAPVPKQFTLTLKVGF